LLPSCPTPHEIPDSSDFSQILHTGGIDGLIAALNKKADDLQN
jgi:hypothetical protein